MALQEYIFNTKKGETKFSIGKEIRHQLLVEVEKADANDMVFHKVSIDKYDIIDNIIVFKKSYLNTFIKVKVEDNMDGLDRITIPFKDDITENKEDIEEANQRLIESITYNTDTQNELEIIEDEVDPIDLLIQTNTDLIKQNTFLIVDTDITQAIKTGNEAIEIYKEVINAGTKVIDFDDEFEFDTEYYDNLKDQAIIDKNNAEQYALESDVSNNVELGKIDTAHSSIVSSINNIKISTKEANDSAFLCNGYRNNCLSYKNKTFKDNKNANEWAITAENNKIYAETAQLEAENSRDNVELIANIINDSSIVSNQTYSSSKTENVFIDNLTVAEDIVTSDVLETLITDSNFGSLPTFDSSTLVWEDEIKTYKPYIDEYNRNNFATLYDEIYKKSFGTQSEKNKYNLGDRLVIYSNGAYLGSTRLNNMNYGYNQDIGTDISGNPILRNFFYLDSSRIIDGYFNLILDTYDIDKIIKMEATITNLTTYQTSIPFIEDGILKVFANNYATNCSIMVDSTIGGVVPDDDLLFQNNFNDSNTLLWNSTYDIDNNIVSDDFTWISSIEMVPPYQQEPEDSGFRSFYSELTFELFEYTFYDATNLLFKTADKVVEDQSILVDSVEKVVLAEDLTTIESGGDLSVTREIIDNNSVYKGMYLMDDYICSLNLLTFTVHNKDNTLSIAHSLTIDKTDIISDATSLWVSNVNGMHENIGNLLYVAGFVSSTSLGYRNFLIIYDCSNNTFTSRYGSSAVSSTGTGIIGCTSIIDGYLYTTTGTSNGLLCKFDLNLNLITLVTNVKYRNEYNKTNYIGKIYKTNENTLLWASRSTNRYAGGIIYIIDINTLDRLKTLGIKGALVRFDYDEGIIWYSNYWDEYLMVYEINNNNFVKKFQYDINTTTNDGTADFIYIGLFDNKKYWIVNKISTSCYFLIKDLNTMDFSLSAYPYKFSVERDKYPLCYYWNEDNNLVVFNRYSENVTISAAPINNEYIVDISDMGLATPPTKITSSLPLLNFFSDVDTDGTFPDDLPERIQVDTIIDGNKVKITTELIEVPTSDKRFYKWFVDGFFYKLKKIVTHFTKDG